MEDFQNKGEQDPNEKLVEQSEDEIKSQVIDKFGLDETEHEDLIKSLVADKLEEQKKLSTAIRQKIDWRTKATANPEKKESQQAKVEFDDDLLERKLNEKLEKRELDELDISDELKKKAQSYAKAEGVSIKQALKSDYFLFLKDKEEKAQRAEEASIGGSKKSPTKKDYSSMKPEDFDMKTPEGRAEFAKWEEHIAKVLG